MLLTAAALAAGEPEPWAREPRQDFIAPPPGSYRLPVIQQAPKGPVLDSNGNVGDFSRYTRGRITLLTFMYTYCVDPLGCPLAFKTMMRVRQRLLERPELARRVRLVSLSFDPSHDDPATIRHYAGKLADPASSVRWHFLTTRSVTELKPLLDGLGQDVTVEPDPQGKPTRVRSHLLKMFLIDAQGGIREIYSTAFLVPEVMLNDIETLLLETRPSS